MHRVRVVIAEARAALAELDPGAWDPDAAASVAEELAVLENAVSVARTKLAARAARGGAHRRRGFADVSDWMATATGSTIKESRRQLDTVSKLDACPATSEAVERGEVSLAQAEAIVRAEAEVPGCEAELLDAALGGTLGAVHLLSRTRRLEAMDREELHAKQHRARSHSHWIDEIGMVRGSYALPPEVGIPFVNRLDRETDRLRRAAKRARRGIDHGEPLEPRMALAADALLRLVNGTATTKSGEVVGNIVIDYAAYTRGHAHLGERCHIVGGGPIPARVAREMMQHTFLKVVLTDGVAVQQVLHVGRKMSAELRTALELGPPPEFSGVACAEAGCERRYGLEWDHIHPVAAGGPTSLDNLQALCWPHHAAKSRHEREMSALTSDDGEPGPGGERAPP